MTSAYPTPLPVPIGTAVEDRQPIVQQAVGERRPESLADVAAPRVDVVVVHYNAHEALAEALGPLESALRGGLITVTVIDNDTDSPASQAREFLATVDDGRYVVSDRNRGFGYGSNQGARLGSAPYLLFLNPDCIIDAENIAGMVGRLDDDPTIVAIGPRINRPNGEPEISWFHHPGFVWEARRRRLWKGLEAGQPWALDAASELVSEARDVEWLTAACLMVRRSTFEVIEGFDEEFFLYFEDADLGARLGDHGRLRFEPALHAVHRGGASTEKDKRGTLPHYRFSQRLYYRKHRPLWERLGLRAWRLLKK